MNVFTDFSQCGSIKDAVVTTGLFDGVHIAHKIILQRLKKLAFENSGQTVLITFHPHPRKVLYPDTAGKELYLINSQREKKELLQKAGLDNLVIIEFTPEFSRISSGDFVRNILVEQLHAKAIVTGFNHHFGHNREGSTGELRRLGQQYGFIVEEIPEQEIRNESVSGTRIREALLAGSIADANAYLDHPYMIMGECSLQKRSSRFPGLPVYSLQIEEDNKLIPPDGLYDVNILDDEDSYKGICRIRNKGSSSLDSRVGFIFPDPIVQLSCSLVTMLFHGRIRKGGEEEFLDKFPVPVQQELKQMNP